MGSMGSALLCRALPSFDHLQPRPHPVGLVSKAFPFIEGQQPLIAFRGVESHKGLFQRSSETPARAAP